MFFQSMLNSSRAVRLPKGLHEHDPIRLRDVTATDFEWLVKWLFGDATYVSPSSVTAFLTRKSKSHRECLARITIEGYLAILRLAHRYGIPDAQRFAVSGLQRDRRFKLESAIRLDAAVRYDIRHWFRPAVRKLVSQPLTMLKTRELKVLAGPILADLMDYRRRIEHERVRVLTKDYYFVDSDGCSSTRCSEVWEQMWIQYRHDYLADLDWEKPLRGIHDIISGILSRPDGICSGCYQLSIAPIIENGYFLREEKGQVAAAEHMYNQYMVLKEVNGMEMPNMQATGDPSSLAQYAEDNESEASGTDGSI